MELAYLPFAVAGVAAAVVLAGLAATLASDRVQFWPPGEDDRALRIYDACSNAFLVGVVATGVLDYGSGPFPHPETTVLGVALLAAAVGLSVQAVSNLGTEQTRRGTAGDLQSDGLYALSRNPQNVGYFVGYGSLVLVFDTLLLAPLAVGAVGLWVYLQALIEEPWLSRRYGEQYDRYRERVPRFLGVRTIRRLRRRNR